MLPMLALAVAACAPITGREIASDAVEDWLTDLVEGRAADAWEHLTPATRELKFGDDFAEFARDIGRSNWRAFRWTIGPIIDRGSWWEVNVEIRQDAVPQFLFDRQIAGFYGDLGIVILVQFPAGGGYAIAGHDTDLR